MRDKRLPVETVRNRFASCGDCYACVVDSAGVGTRERPGTNPAVSYLALCFKLVVF